RGPLLRAAPPLAALGAGVLTRHVAALRDGQAVASEITNAGWRERLGHVQVPERSAREAGQILAAIAATNQLTLFAHYSTDAAGHARELAAGIAALERLDQFLGGVVTTVSADTFVLVVSDHGNLEDTRVGHTRNPALALAVGSGHGMLATRLQTLTDVPAAVLALLAIESHR
ncbi:MAG: hypothetical protein ACRELD_05590, partial [Longimicrobiales bacterium]